MCGRCPVAVRVEFPELCVPVHVRSVCNSGFASIWFVCGFCESQFGRHVVGDQMDFDVGWHRRLCHHCTPELGLQAEVCRVLAHFRQTEECRTLWRLKQLARLRE